MAQLTKVRDIIDDYERKHLGVIKKELSACNEVSRDYVYGKRLKKHSVEDVFLSPNSHQRLFDGELEEVVDALTRANLQSLTFESFEDLYDAVRQIYSSNGHPNAILAIYDTALRIGYNHSPQILPQDYVYLYGGMDKDQKPRGPKGGVIALYGEKWVNAHINPAYPYRIETKWFADKFPNLPSWEIESILCIYANKFTFNMPY